MTANLFDPFQLGDLMLANRLVMAPLTRNRTDANGVATLMMATHYRQRAGAGLVSTESSPVSPQAIGYPFTPGHYTDAHVEGWRRVTDAVHEKGSISLSSFSTVAGYPSPVFSRTTVCP